MWLKITLAFAVFIIVCISPVPSHSQESWDLRKCIDFALENSLSVQAADYNVQSARVTETFFRHQRYPNLNGSSGLSWNFGRSVDPTTNEFIGETFFSNNWGLSTNMVLYDGLRIKNSIRQSRLDTEASISDKRQAERDLSLNVAFAYLNVLFAQENLQNSLAQLEVSEKQLEQVDKLIDAGNRPRNDRLDLVAQVTSQEQVLINDQNNIDIQMLSLKQLMNLDPSYEMLVVPPQENITVISDPDRISFPEAFESALRNQPGIDAGETRLRSAELGVDLAKSNFYPTITVGASLFTNYSNKGLRIDDFTTQRIEQTAFINNEPFVFGIDQEIPITSKSPYGDQINDNLSYGFGFNFSIPIYNNYNTKSNVEQGRIAVLGQKNLNDQVVQALKTSVQQTLADARAAKKALEAAERTAEAQLAAFENSEKRYELGIINTYDYIQAKNLYDSSNISLIIAKYDYLFKLKLLDFYMGRPLSLD